MHWQGLSQPYSSDIDADGFYHSYELFTCIQTTFARLVIPSV